MEPVSNTPPVPRKQEREKVKDPRAEERKQLREREYQDALGKLQVQHLKEKRDLSQKLSELARTCWDVQEGRLWPGNISGEENRGSSQQENRASSSAAASKGKEVLGEGDGRIPVSEKCSLKASQRDKDNQALWKEHLAAKTEKHVEVQHLLEDLDKKELRKVYDHRIEVEDPREIEAHQQISAKAEIEFVDGRRGRPKFPECYEEIKKLLDIEKSPIFSTTLAEWNRKEELLIRRVERKKNQVAILKNEVYQLIGFVSVFQGVVLTAVSQSGLLDCHNKWSPIALSVLASVVSTIGVLQKWKQIGSLQKTIDSEDRDSRTAAQVGKRLRGTGPKEIDFVRLNVEIEGGAKPKSKSSRGKSLYYVFVILTLVAFGVLFPVSFWSILCKSGAPPPAQ